MKIAVIGSISRDIWKEIKVIAKAISKFNPYTEGKDCLVLREASK